MHLAEQRDAWPALPFEAWKETCRTLHRWTQMVGKVRLALAPHTNHWWQVPLYVTARGLTTSPMPYGSHVLEMSFDFLDDVLRIEMSDGRRQEIALAPQSVAQFYNRFMDALRQLEIDVKIWPMPVEVPDPVRFDLDTSGVYDAAYAHRFWRILIAVDAILKQFRARFIGKCSPVHFFWGSFDLAVTRFSGKVAPVTTAADAITREAYSHEVISAGFWPGGGAVSDAAFYAYTVPQPAGLSESAIRPAEAFYSKELGEFLYLYDDMRRAAAPEVALLDFLQSTYEAGANLGGWDRSALERQNRS